MIVKAAFRAGVAAFVVLSCGGSVVRSVDTDTNAGGGPTGAGTGADNDINFVYGAVMFTF